MLPGETVLILTGAVVTDEYGNEGTDWSTPAEAPVDNVLCEPRPSGEPAQDARNSVTSGYTLYIRVRPVMPTIVPTNRVRVRGVDYDVMGEPSDWRMGEVGGLVVQTSRVAG
jgi:hypothetical protein